MALFPTQEWLNGYRDAVNEDEKYAEYASDWGDGWNGDFIFEIRGLPLDEHTVSDLPDDLLALRRVPEGAWEGVDEGARETVLKEYGDVPVSALSDEIPEAALDSLPNELGGLLEEAEDFFEDDPGLDEAADELPDELRRVLPPRLDELMGQLEELVTDEGRVYAHLGLEGGRCTEVDVVGGRDDSDAAFVLYGEYDDWKNLVEGEDPINLVMSGKLELDGDLNRVMEYAEAAQRLAGVASETETEYIF
jgi:putative sterol carrier protein